MPEKGFSIFRRKKINKFTPQEILSSRKTDTIIPQITSQEKTMFEEYGERLRKWNEEDKRNPKGQLGMTAEDHRTIGSTPPAELAANPGKTRADLMSDKQIREYLLQIEKDLEFLSSENKTPLIESLIKSRRKDFTNSLTYLKRIGRIPEEYKKEDNN